jgi:predicted RNA-binding protein YlqC (UPF0109 family)
MAGAGETSAPVDIRNEGNLMKDLLEYIARALVDRPDEVQVQMSGGGDRVRLELRVAQTDMGRIIGKSGKVANAIRTMLRVAAERRKQATLDVVEPES